MVNSLQDTQFDVVEIEADEAPLVPLIIIGVGLIIIGLSM